MLDYSASTVQLAKAFAHYETESALGASLLAEASYRHLARHAPGAWALAGIAQRS